MKKKSSAALILDRISGIAVAIWDALKPKKLINSRLICIVDKVPRY